MKVQVSVSEEMVKKIDRYAEKMGVSRSSLCSVLIGNGIMGYDKAFALMDSVVEEEKNKMKVGKIEE